MQSPTLQNRPQKDFFSIFLQIVQKNIIFAPELNVFGPRYSQRCAGHLIFIVFSILISKYTRNQQRCSLLVFILFIRFLRKNLVDSGKMSTFAPRKHNSIIKQIIWSKNEKNDNGCKQLPSGTYLCLVSRASLRLRLEVWLMRSLTFCYNCLNNVIELTYKKDDFT